MSMILTYYIPRFDIYDVLKFTDLENDRVFDLVDRIFERHERLFSDNNIDHGTLVLSKVPDTELLPRDTLQQRIASARTLEVIEDVRPTLKETFEGLDIWKLVVLVDLRKIPSKRMFDAPAEGDLSRFKRSRPATIPPSEHAKPSQYIKTQQNTSERILDDRPVADRGVPPAALLYEGFGEFQDICDGRRDPMHLDEKLLTALEEAVDDFALSMCGFYDSERFRMTAGLGHLNKIFSIGKSSMPKLAASSIGNVRSDGHFLGEHGEPVAVVEFKDNVESGIVTAQLAGYYAHALSEALLSDPDNKSLFASWRVPCLGISIVGPYIAFYAMIFLGGRERIVALTPALSFIQCASDGKQRQALYSAFSAVSVLVSRILQETEDPPKNTHASLFSPAISSMPEYGNENKQFVFRIKTRLSEGVEHRLVYLAETREHGTILLKFARTYSIELHALCSGLGHAPNIIGFQRLPGDWCAVAMEYFPSATRISRARELATYRETWANELKTLVNAFHAEGLVHGDLRDPNIVCDGRRVMLLDFDWAGKDGEASYPTAKLCKELTEGRLNKGLKITKEDDIRVLDNTLNALSTD